jgi:hypothetical protein
VKRGLIVGRGSRLLRFGAVVGETAGEKPGRCDSARGWITAGELVTPRGEHDSCEGPLKGKVWAAAARDKAAKFDLARKPLRG